PNKCSNPGYCGGGHGRTSLKIVFISRHCGIDSVSGRKYVHVNRTVIGKGGYHFRTVFASKGTYRNYVVRYFGTIVYLIVGKIGIVGIVQVLAGISCRMYKKNIVFSSVFNSIVYPIRIGGEGLTKTPINDFCPIVNGITDTQGNILIVFITIGYGPDTHDGHIIGYSIGTFSIVSFGSDNTGNMGTMAFISYPALWISIAIIGIVDIIGVVPHDFPTIKIRI